MAASEKLVRIDKFQHRKLEAIRARCRKAKAPVVPSIPVLIRIGLDLSMTALESKFTPSDD